MFSSCFSVLDKKPFRITLDISMSSILLLLQDNCKIVLSFSSVFVGVI